MIFDAQQTDGCSSSYYLSSSATVSSETVKSLVSNFSSMIESDWLDRNDTVTDDDTQSVSSSTTIITDKSTTTTGSSKSTSISTYNNSITKKHKPFQPMSSTSFISSFGDNDLD